MKFVHFFFLVTSLYLLSQNTLTAQSQKQFDPLKTEISDFLPPLSILIDSAIVNSPDIHQKDLQMIIDNCKLKESRKDWARYMGVQSDIRYGTYDNYSTGTETGQPTVAQLTSRNELRWGYGAYINFPLFGALNRKNQIKMAKTEVEQAQSNAEAQRNELKQIVIRQYNDLILKQRLLRIKSKLLETSRINMQMTEKEFANGVISVTEYARISEIVSLAESDYENVRSEFLTSYMILEQIVGMKFNLTNSIKATNEGG